MATIRKVADLAGVSTATVSHVINDTRAVSAPLTARVLNAMEQLDYHPDVVARSLRRRETLTLGLIVPSIEIPFFARVAAGVEAAANDAGYSVILCNSGWSLARELHYLNNLLARRVDGLLCISLAMTAEHIAPLLRRRTPVVLFERAPCPASSSMPSRSTTSRAPTTPPRICSTWDTGASAASPVSRNSTLNEERIRGYRQSAGAARHPVRPESSLRTGDYSAAAGVRTDRASCSDLPEPPTADLCLQ